MNSARLLTTVAIIVGASLTGCDASWQAPLPREGVAAKGLAPTTQPGPDDVRLDASAIQPMHLDLLAIDLPTVAAVATARNIDILSARQRVEASHGRYASSIGSALPSLVPAIGFGFHRGGARDTTGAIVTGNYVALHPAAAVQWVVNPGQVIHDVIASRKRLSAAQQDELSVGVRTLQQAAAQYYGLCLAQAGVSAALEAQSNAEELVRVAAVRLKAERAVPADDLRAQAALAGRQQDVLLAVNAFYYASVALATTLRLDPAVTHVARPDKLTRTALVRDDMTLDMLMAMAVERRPDLKAVRELIAAAEADKAAIAWGGLGPAAITGYQAGGIASRASGVDYPMRLEQVATAGAGFRLGLAIIGDLQSADARQRLAVLAAQSQLDQLRGEVVAAVQDSRASDKLVPLAVRQLAAAQEGLRQVQAAYTAGRAILLDVLDAQSVLAQARLRYAQAVAGYNQSRVNILASLGILDAASLGQPDSLENKGD
ncbi:MAG: TolC family protein [Phycisphaerae bacterium]